MNMARHKIKKTVIRNDQPSPTRSFKKTKKPYSTLRPEESVAFGSVTASLPHPKIAHCLDLHRQFTEGRDCRFLLRSHLASEA